MAPREVMKSREWDKLEQWGLCVRRANMDPTKKNSGIWAPTQNGVDFVYKRLKLWSHAVFLNGKADRFDGDHITIVEALRKKFDYQELMNEVINPRHSKL
jgi:hypothetical protein